MIWSSAIRGHEQSNRCKTVENKRVDGQHNTPRPDHHLGRQTFPLNMSHRIASLTLLLAVLLAAFLRLWNLDAMPPGFYHDEAYNALDALSLLEGRTFPQFYEGWELYRSAAHGERGPFETKTPIFFEGNYGREPLHIYLMALSIKLFGANVWAVRLVPALAGVLGVVTTAWAAWQLAPTQRRWEVAAFAAWGCAILFPAVHFSRFGLRAMLFVPVETVCVGMFWKWLNQEPPPLQKAGNIRWLILAGVLLGGGLYVYAAARMLPLLFVIFCGWYLIGRGVKSPRSGLRNALKRVAGSEPLRGFIIMAGVAFLVAMPMLIYFWAYPYFLFFRSSYVATHGMGVVEGQPVWTAVLNFGRIARGFIWQGETHLRHNLTGRPYMDAIQVAFAGLGLVAVAKWRSDKRLFLLVWFFVMWLPSLLSGDAPHFGRLTGVVPVVAILIGSGATLLYYVFKPARMLIYLLLIVSSFWTYYDYFIVYGNHPDLAADFYLSDRQLGEWGATLPAGTDIYLTPTREELATILFGLGAARENFRNYAGEVVLFGRSDSATVHLISADDIQTRERLEPFTMTSEQIQPTWIAVWLKPPPFEPIGTLAETIRVDGQIRRLDSGEIAVTLDWQPLTLIDRPLTAFVHLTDDAGNVIVQQDRPPSGYPTTDWKVGEQIRDRFILAPTMCATCQIVTGFYDPTTEIRLGEPIILPAEMTP
jgi:4-amino-4-deoxy-L-arabinose transferase-like glycosyltransferase